MARASMSSVYLWCPIDLLDVPATAQMRSETINENATVTLSRSAPGLLRNSQSSDNEAWPR